MRVHDLIQTLPDQDSSQLLRLFTALVNELVDRAIHREALEHLRDNGEQVAFEELVAMAQDYEI